MLRPNPQHLLRHRSALRLSLIRHPRPFLTQNRVISTTPPQRPRSWRSLFVRVGLAVGAVYYYNTSKLFAEEPLYAVPPPQNVSSSSSEEAAFPTLDSLTTPRPATAPVPTLASQPRIDPNTTTTASSIAPQSALSSGPNPIPPQQQQQSPSPLEETEEEASQQGAFNEETGEINWDCPCLGGMAHGTCGEQFRAAFSCFVFSKEEPKGMDCIEHFKTMQGCFREHPDEYGAELEDEDGESGSGGDEMEHERVAEGPGDGGVGDQRYASGEPLPESARKGIQAAEHQTTPPSSSSLSSSPRTSAVTEPKSSGPVSSSSPTGDHPTQSAKAAKAQVAQQYGDPVSESDEIVPKAAHDARDAVEGTGK